MTSDDIIDICLNLMAWMFLVGFLLVIAALSFIFINSTVAETLMFCVILMWALGFVILWLHPYIANFWLKNDKK
jgi:hypothetical protein